MKLFLIVVAGSITADLFRCLVAVLAERANKRHRNFRASIARAMNEGHVEIGEARRI